MSDIPSHHYSILERVRHTELQRTLDGIARNDAEVVHMERNTLIEDGKVGGPETCFMVVRSPYGSAEQAE